MSLGGVTDLVVWRCQAGEMGVTEWTAIAQAVGSLVGLGVAVAGICLQVWTVRRSARDAREVQEREWARQDATALAGLETEVVWALGAYRKVVAACEEGSSLRVAVARGDVESALEALEKVSDVRATAYRSEFERLSEIGALLEEGNVAGARRAQAARLVEEALPDFRYEEGVRYARELLEALGETLGEEWDER